MELTSLTMSCNVTPELCYPSSAPTTTAPQFKEEPIDDDSYLLYRRSPSYHPHSPTPESNLGSDPTIPPCTTPPMSLACTPTPPAVNGGLMSPITPQHHAPQPAPGVHPGPPWMLWHELPGIPTYAITDNGHTKALPYISF